MICESYVIFSSNEFLVESNGHKPNSLVTPPI